MTRSNNAYSYDAIPYPGNAYPETHPDRLATIGVLFGMEPPAIRSCRVLDIGCGEGSNIIPMAGSLPQAEFVGIDLAEKPIRQAQALIQKAGLSNISVRADDGSSRNLVRRGTQGGSDAKPASQNLTLTGQPFSMAQHSARPVQPRSFTLQIPLIRSCLDFRRHVTDVDAA